MYKQSPVSAETSFIKPDKCARATFVLPSNSMFIGELLNGMTSVHIQRSVWFIGSREKIPNGDIIGVFSSYVSFNNKGNHWIPNLCGIAGECKRVKI